MSAALSHKPEENGADLVGSFRRIGQIGPPYEVIAVAQPGHMQICLLESGEIVDYPVEDVREDPLA